MKEFGILCVVAAVLLAVNPKLLEKVERFFGGETVQRERFIVPAEFRSVVGPIVFYDVDRADAVKLAGFFRRFAADVDTLQTAEDVRAWNVQNGETDCPGLKGKYPGLAADVDRVLAAGIGAEHYADGSFESVTLSDSGRKNLVLALRSLGWAFER